MKSNLTGLPKLVKTLEAAQHLHKAAQTLRKEYCLKGHYLGMRPVKVGRDLLWRVTDIEVVLNGGEVTK